jgi:hypothetical protein
MQRFIVGAVLALFATLGLAAASDAGSISASCLAGPSTATCFRPSTVIDGVNDGTPIPPVFVEVVDSNGNTPGGTISLNMQANFGSDTGFKLFYVAMNLDPNITPSALSFVFDPTSTETSPVTIGKTTQDAQSAAPEKFFDLLFEFSASGPGDRFTASETIGWTVTCDAGADADCANFGATSFNFLNTADGAPDFRICTHIGGLPGGASEKVCGGAGEETTTTVPEPGTVLLFGFGLTAVAAAARRKAKK